MLRPAEVFAVRSRQQSLPQRSHGQKDFLPDGSEVQESKLRICRSEQWDLLEEERVERLGSLGRGIWRPEEDLVELTLPAGKFWQTMGFSKERRQCLQPEEAIYLLECGSIQLLYGGLPLSVQGAYEEMMGEGSLSLLCYQVYSHLKRLGYVVTRFNPSSVKTPYERRLNLDIRVARKRKRSPSPSMRSKLKSTNNSKEQIHRMTADTCCPSEENASSIHPSRHHAGEENASSSIHPSRHHAGEENVSSIHPSRHDAGEEIASSSLQPSRHDAGEENASSIHPSRHDAGEENASSIHPSNHHASEEIASSSIHLSRHDAGEEIASSSIHPSRHHASEEFASSSIHPSRHDAGEEIASSSIHPSHHHASEEFASSSIHPSRHDASEESQRGYSDTSKRSRPDPDTYKATFPARSRWDFSKIRFPNCAPDRPCVALRNPEPALIPENVTPRPADISHWLGKLNLRREKPSRREEEQWDWERKYKTSLNAEPAVQKCTNWTQYKAFLQEKRQQTQPPNLWKSDIQPLLKPGARKHTVSVLEKIKVMRQTTLLDEGKRIHQMPKLPQIQYNLYQADGSSAFKKSKPGKPYAHLCVRSFDEEIPSLITLKSLAYQSGDVPVVFALVDYGEIAFYTFKDFDLPVDVYP